MNKLKSYYKFNIISNKEGGGGGGFYVIFHYEKSMQCSSKTNIFIFHTESITENVETKIEFISRINHRKIPNVLLASL